MFARINALSLFVFILLPSVSCKSVEDVTPIITREIIADNIPYHQSFAIYGDFVFLISPQGICRVYNLVSKSVVGTIDIDHKGFSLPHGNVCCFGKKINEESEFPLLYVSQWNGEGACLVYEISKNESGLFTLTLKQTIIYKDCNTDKYGSVLGDWVVDADNGFIYSFKYHLESSTISDNNYNHICQFALPSVADSEVIGFKDSDVIDAFSIPFIPIMQDKKIKNNLLYVASGGGGYSQSITIVDLQQNKTIKSIDLSCWGGEPEGLDVSKGIVLSYEGDDFLYTLVYD